MVLPPTPYDNDEDVLPTVDTLGGENGVDFTADLFENKNLIFQAMLLGTTIRLAKMKGGMRTIQVLGKAIIDGLFKTTNSLGKASAGNYIAAWANPVLISGLFERFGMLPPHFNAGYHDAISKLTGLTAATSILDTVFGKDGAFPQNINFGSEGGESSETEMLKALVTGTAGGAV